MDKIYIFASLHLFFHILKLESLFYHVCMALFSNMAAIFSYQAK